METDKRNLMTGGELDRKLQPLVQQKREFTGTPPESFGDRLAAIGREHGVTAQDIAQVNSLRDCGPAAPMDVE